MSRASELRNRAGKGGASEPAKVVARPQSAPAVPCLNRGPAVPPPAGKSPVRTYFRCDHPAKPLGAVVCPCTGCGPSCKGYEPDGEPPIPPGWVVVPQPPPLELYPRHKWAVVTVVVGEEAERCFAASAPLMRQFAVRVGADLVVSKWPGHPDWPMSSKFGIAPVLDHYERILYVDADVLLRPGCVNPFEMCPANAMGVVDELQHHRQQVQYGREKGYVRFRRARGFRKLASVPWYFNAGVMVVPASHRELLLPPVGPMPAGHCSEQDHTNARLLDSGLPYCLLDRRCNWQNWTDWNWRAAPADAVLHWSGAGGERRNRAAEMRAVAEACLSGRATSRTGRLE